MTPWIQTSIYAPAADYNLTDLLTVKDELSLTSSDTAKDAFLTRSISQISSSISNYCNRVFKVEGLTDSFLWAGSYFATVDTIKLSRWPVVDVVSVIQTLSNGLTKTLVEGTDFLVNYSTGICQRLDSSGRATGWETLPVAIKYVAGFGVETSQTATIPATPFQVTVSKSGAFAVDGGVTYANGTALVPVASAPAVGQYSVVAGVYTFNTADAGASVTISYAYNKMPDDLVEATLRMTTMRFKQKDRDPMLMSQSQPNLGDQRWWVGTVPGQQGAFPPEIASLLDNYNVPMLA